MGNGISRSAQEMIDDSFKDITSAIVDYHTHLAGSGTHSGCFIHGDVFSLYHPISAIQYTVFKRASGVESEFLWDLEYVQELVKRVKQIKDNYPSWGQHYLLAFDKNYDKEGNPVVEHTGLYVPNEYMMQISTEHPDIFIPCISVHPYRKDAAQELEKWASKGVHLVKWLPNAMGIDPSDPLCDPFYEKLRSLRMILLTHTGLEHSINPPGMDNSLGNPLKLRRALDKGVMVIAAHCASEGYGEDLDNPGKTVSYFRLLLRMLDDPKYAHNLFCDISTMCAFLRLGDPLTTMLERQDLHNRLVFGTDYPLPAVYFLIQTSTLYLKGYITIQEAYNLNEIYYVNPLLFDYVVKRVIKSPNDGKSRFSASVFMKNPALEAYVKGACFVSTKAVVSVREHEFCDVIQEFMADNTRMFPKLEVGDSRRKESVDFPVPPIQQRTRTAAS